MLYNMSIKYSINRSLRKSAKKAPTQPIKFTRKPLTADKFSEKAMCYKKQYKKKVFSFECIGLLVLYWFQKISLIISK